MKKSLKRALSLILTAAMLLTVMLPAFAAGGSAADNKVRFHIEQTENGPDALHAGKADSAGLNQMLPTGDVRVSIVLSDKATLENGFSAKGIASDKQAGAYRSRLLNKQNALAEQISKEILGGKKLDVKWNLTLAANIISAVVPSVAIGRIEKLAGVEKVVLERQYEPAVASVGETADPNMATATKMTGAPQAWANGYTGLGSKVAVIDTGIDTDHKSFDESAFLASVEASEKEADLLTAEEVAAVYGDLNIAGALPGVDEDAYISAKIPFAVNYVDGDLDVTHDNDEESEHGSHVAGIAAANRLIATEDGFDSALNTVKTQGAAPDAQILVMKVFGKGGGAYDSDYMAAIEDAVMLGADAINLSLGSSNPGYATDDTYQEILDNFQKYDAVVSISAGNAGAWADSSTYGVTWAEDVSFDTVGSPGSFANAFTVASVDNDGNTGNYFYAAGVTSYPFFYTENLDYGNAPFTTLAGEKEFVYIDSVGTEEEFAAVKDVLKGKIAICNRGETSFFEKANAAMANGAIGVIIANNQPGTIGMNLTGYTYNAPVVSITQIDGRLIKGYFSEPVTDDEDNVLYYTGTLTIGDDVLVNETDIGFHTMSDFSSFGVPGDLSLKPEITAPGGNIYSVNGLVPGGEAYENMSGTSMAAPQIAGLTALVAQYIRENGLEEKTGLSVRQLTQSLLMSTAEPLTDVYGYYYSVFQQGAGLANADSAINAKSYILMDEMWDYAADGKVKAELGDDPERTGEYEVSFSINNFSGEDVEYELAADFFTQYMGAPAQGYPDVRDISTDFIGADVRWTVNGKELDAAAAAQYDFNDDAAANTADVRFLLDFITGNEAELLSNAEYADFDKDGDVDTYDAYQILKELNSAVVNAPAGGKTEITAKIVLDETLAEAYDVNGNYVEGYLYASEVSTEDGAMGVVHSIPVLGFYGSWTEASMTDIGSALEYDYDIADRLPYVMDNATMAAYSQAAETGDSFNPSVQGFYVKYPGDSKAYYFGGNPVVYEDTYLPERNSINAAASLDYIRSTLIRNAADSRFFVTDAEGNVVYELQGGQVASAFYYANQGDWFYTSNTVKTNYKPADFAEGDALTFNISYAPEYYVGEDGEIDWNALGDGATTSISAVIDNTAPELKDAFMEGYDPDTAMWDAFTVTAKDNRYIAAVAVFNDWGEPLAVIPADPEAKEGEETTLTFYGNELYDNSWFGVDRLLVQVYDYAGNYTNYKINFDAEDLASDVIVNMPETAGVLLNTTARLQAEVYPWGVDESLVWTSSDESIATVDENGVVTGVAVGECVITATSAIAPFAKAECLVTVTQIEKTLNGVVWDEEGRQWFSEIDVAKLPEYTKLTESHIGDTITAVSYGPEGYLFAANDKGELYIVDGETFELVQDLGNLGVELSDIAASKYVGDGILMAVCDTQVLLIDLYTGEVGAFDYADDLGGNIFVGIAAFESFIHPTYNAGVDAYFLLDDAGNVYEDGYIVIEDNDEIPDGTYDFGLEKVSEFGFSTDSYHYNSLYFDGTSLYWARFNDDSADLICEYDVFDLDVVANLGSFAEDVWPAAALFELDVNPIDFNFEEEESAGSAKFASSAVKDAAVAFTAAAPVLPAGSLNTAPDTDPVADDPSDVNVFAQTVELTADKAASNGLFTVKYDAENFALESVRSATAYYSVNDDAENGVVTFAYVTKDGAAFAEGDTVATLNFVTLGTDDGVYTVTTKEINNEHPENASETVTATSGHSFAEPAWTWTATETGYTATYSIICNAHKDCEENVVIEASVEVFESAEATCTEGVGKRYVATVELDGETLTDVLEEYTEQPLGHNMAEVEAADPTCTEDGIIACFYCDRCETYFADEEGSEPLTEEDVILPAPGHDIEFVEAYIPCISEGFAEHYECTVCGALFADENGETEVDAESLITEATGHSWDEGVLIKEPTCTSGGVLLFTCENNPNHTRSQYVPAFGHTTEKTEAADPTCIEDGNVEYYTCTVCEGVFADEIGSEPLEDVVIPALGHELALVSAVDATCTEDGNVEYYACAVCEKFFADENGETELADVVIPAEGHTLVKTDAKAPTCVNDGNMEFYTCSVCGKRFADAKGVTELKDVVIPAEGHEWDNGTVVKAPTCTEKGLMMFACEKDPTHIAYVATPADGHKLEKAEAKDAACTEDGNVAYYVCTVCGETFADENGETPLADTVVPATGHTLVKTDAKPATCTEDGNVEYYTCSACGKIFADADGKNELTDTVVPAAHTLEKVEAKAATAEAEGNIEYYRCTECGKYFADAEGKQELAPEDVVTAKLTFMLGDVDQDGKITSEDARLALRASVHLENYASDSVEFHAADVDFDGEITANDARKILRAVVELEDPATWVPQSEEPGEEPSSDPTEEPSSDPAEEPSSTPVEEPSSDPAEEPSSTPTEEPSSAVEEPSSVNP